MASKCSGPCATAGSQPREDVSAGTAVGARLAPPSEAFPSEASPSEAPRAAALGDLERARTLRELVGVPTAAVADEGEGEDDALPARERSQAELLAPPTALGAEELPAGLCAAICAMLDQPRRLRQKST